MICRVTVFLGLPDAPDVLDMGGSCRGVLCVFEEPRSATGESERCVGLSGPSSWSIGTKRERIFMVKVGV